MSGGRCKWIKKLVKEMDQNMLFSLRNHLGSRTEDMTSRQVYKAAKHLYPKVGKKENWGCQIVK